MLIGRNLESKAGNLSSFKGKFKILSIENPEVGRSYINLEDENKKVIRLYEGDQFVITSNQES